MLETSPQFVCFNFRCQFTSHRRQISDKKAKRNVSAKCSIAENVQNVKFLHLHQKQIEIIKDQKKESKRRKRNVFSVQQENLSASIFLLPCFFLHIRSYLYYLCFFPPTYKLMCLLPLFCYPYSLIFTVFNSIIIPTLIARFSRVDGLPMFGKCTTM